MKGRKRIERIGSFSATDEQGNVHIVIVSVDILESGHMGDPHAETRGMTSLKTKTGYTVTDAGNGKYKIVQTGQTLTPNDPEEVERLLNDKLQ
jgi:hypothetical protein